MTTSCAPTLNSRRAMQTPSPGAVWPAIVRNGAVTERERFRKIVPETRNTMMRGPLLSTA
jgi:hypothetical protein